MASNEYTYIGKGIQSMMPGKNLVRKRYIRWTGSQPGDAVCANVI